jgi:hypothetical protein
MTRHFEAVKDDEKKAKEAKVAHEERKDDNIIDAAGNLAGEAMDMAERGLDKVADALGYERAVADGTGAAEARWHHMGRAGM